MVNRNVGIVVLVIAAVVGAVVMLAPLGWRSSDTAASIAPEFGSQVAVADSRIVLPPVAGEPAALYFEIANRGEMPLVVTQIDVEHAPGVMLADRRRPVTEEIVNLHIDPGETIRLAPEAEHAVLMAYDSNVVPGAEIDVALTFDNGESIDFTAVAETATGRTQNTPAG